MAPIRARSRRPTRDGSSTVPRFVVRTVSMLSSSSRASSAERTGVCFSDDVFGAAHGVGGVHVENVAGHQPVKKHAQSGQVLLDGGRGETLPADP